MYITRSFPRKSNSAGMGWAKEIVLHAVIVLVQNFSKSLSSADNFLSSYAVSFWALCKSGNRVIAMKKVDYRDVTMKFFFCTKNTFIVQLFDLHYKNYFQSCTFINILTEKINQIYSNIYNRIFSPSISYTFSLSFCTPRVKMWKIYLRHLEIHKSKNRKDHLNLILIMAMVTHDLLPMLEKQ